MSHAQLMELFTKVFQGEISVNGAVQEFAKSTVKELSFAYDEESGKVVVKGLGKGPSPGFKRAQWRKILQEEKLRDLTELLDQLDKLDDTPSAKNDLQEALAKSAE